MSVVVWGLAVDHMRFIASCDQLITAHAQCAVISQREAVGYTYGMFIIIITYYYYYLLLLLFWPLWFQS